MATVAFDRTPERSIQQRMDALKRANEIRIRRSQLKRDLKAGRIRVDAMLIAPPQWLDTMKVFDLLLATPKVGRSKVNVMLADAKVSPSKTVDGLSERQRRELIELVRAPTYPTMRRRSPSSGRMR